MDDATPTVIKIVGTREFAEKYSKMLRLLDLEARFANDLLTQVRAAVDDALIGAYMDGFNEGLCK